MRAPARAKRIRELQREVAASARRKQVRKDKVKELCRLLCQHIRWETRTDKRTA